MLSIFVPLEQEIPATLCPSHSVWEAQSRLYCCTAGSRELQHLYRATFSCPHSKSNGNNPEQHPAPSGLSLKRNIQF